MLLFHVSLTGHGCKQISHKDLNCSAESLADITLKQHQSGAPISAFCILYPVTDGLPNGLAPSCGTYIELHALKSLLKCDFFFFLSTVTMVLFLMGISVAVNYSSHENQTAGNF